MSVTVTDGVYTAEVASDTTATGEFQLVKLGISTATSDTLIPADAGNGLDVDVTRLPALPAGTNNIGDVDVLTLPALMTDGTQKAIVRGGAKGATSAADVTSTAAGDDHQALDVNIVAGGGSGGTAMADDGAFTPGTTNVTPAAGVFQGTPDSVNDGDAGAFRMTVDRRQIVQLQDILTPAGDSIMDDTLNGAGMVLLNAIQSRDGSFDIIDSIAVEGFEKHDAAASGDRGPVRIGLVAKATAQTAVSADGDVANVAGTLAGQMRTVVETEVAHDAADAGNAIPLAARATTALSGLTLVADADRTKLMAGVDGVLITRPGYNLEAIVTGDASNTDGTSTEVIAAGAAGIKHYLSWVALSNAHASTFATVQLKDGTTVKATLPVPPAGGVVFKFDPPIPGTAATAWNFDPSAAVTTITCSAGAFKSKV